MTNRSESSGLLSLSSSQKRPVKKKKYRRRNYRNEEEEEEENGESHRTIEDIKNSFITRNLFPLSKSGSKKEKRLSHCGEAVSQYLSDEGPTGMMIAKRTATRAGMIQPPYAKILKEEHMELLGIIAHTKGFQTSCFITMLLDLVLLCLPNGTLLDTGIGQKINLNFLKIYIAESCGHKSRLLEFCIENALLFMEDHAFDSGWVEGDFIKKNLIDEMTVKDKKNMVVVDEEFGLSIRRLRNNTNRELYDTARQTYNLLYDGGGIRAARDKRRRMQWKFNLFGATQMLPCLQLMHHERGSGDAMTKRFDLYAMVIGNESGDFGPKLKDIWLDVFIYALVFTLLSAHQKNKRPMLGYSTEAQPLFNEYISEKEEAERDLNERNIELALGLVEQIEDTDELLDKLRSEKSLSQKAISLSYLTQYLDACLTQKKMFIKNFQFDQKISKQNLQHAMVVQRCVDRQRQEIKLTLDALDNAVGNTITFSEADRLITFIEKDRQMVRDILLSPGWFTLVRSIFCMYRRTNNIKVSEIVAEMETMTVSYGQYHFSGIYKEIKRTKGYIKCHPRHINALFLHENDITMKEYETAFFSSTASPFSGCSHLTHWQLLVHYFALNYPVYCDEDSWLHDFVTELQKKHGQNARSIRVNCPDQKICPEVTRKNLFVRERSRGLELCTVVQRRDRIKMRIDWFDILFKSFEQANFIRQSMATRQQKKIISERDPAREPDPLVEKELQNLLLDMKASQEQTDTDLERLSHYISNQQELLAHMTWLIEKEQIANKEKNGIVEQRIQGDGTFTEASVFSTLVAGDQMLQSPRFEERSDGANQETDFIDNTETQDGAAFSPMSSSHNGEVIDAGRVSGGAQFSYMERNNGLNRNGCTSDPNVVLFNNRVSGKRKSSSCPESPFGRRVRRSGDLLQLD